MNTQILDCGCTKWFHVESLSEKTVKYCEKHDPIKNSIVLEPTKPVTLTDLQNFYNDVHEQKLLKIDFNDHANKEKLEQLRKKNQQEAEKAFTASLRNQLIEYASTETNNVIKLDVTRALSDAFWIEFVYEHKTLATNCRLVVECKHCTNVSIFESGAEKSTVRICEFCQEAFQQKNSK